MPCLTFSSVAEVVTFATAILAGISMIMGLNAVNSAPSFMLDYLKYVEGDENAVAKNPTFWTKILTFYTVVTQVTQAAAEPLNLTQFACRFSFLSRLLAASVGMILELLVIVVLPHGRTTENGAIVALMFMAFIGGFTRAFFENTSYALFGPFPSKMMSAVLIGVAVSGSLVSLLQIILLAAMPMDFKGTLAQAAIYFGISLGIIFLTAVMLVLLLWNSYARRYVTELASERGFWRNIYTPVDADAAARAAALAARQQHERELAAGEPIAAATGDSTDDRELAQSGGKGSKRAAGEEDEEDDGEVRAVSYDPAALNADERAAAVRRHGGSADPAPGLVAELAEGEESGSAGGAAAAPEGELTTAEMLQTVRLWPVIKKIYPTMISCFLTFFCTYLLYPGVMIAVDAEDYWYTTLIMAVYNFCDLVGRVFSMWELPWPPRWVILVASLLRLLLIPYLLLCATHVIPTQAAAYVGTAVLGVTNGWAGTLSMVFSGDAPGITTEAERALAGQATGVCLLLGCAVGSLLQLAIVLPL